MSLQNAIARISSPWFQIRPFADRTLCHFLRGRLTLPSLALPDLFDGFDNQPVILRKIPRGGWSTPTQDVVMLLKLVSCSKPRRLMEIGSFRGYTALSLAQHVGSNATIVTVDRFAGHGEAYRQTPEATRIERRIGDTSPELFENDGRASFDLIFIDADHTYQGVRHDTELCLPLVSPGGYMVWHDYANWGYFSRYNGVPEYLGDLSGNLSIAHVRGSDLAIYSPAWDVEGGPERSLYLSAITQAKPLETGSDPWTSTGLR